MSKIASARILVFVALVLSAWVLLSSVVAPFASVGGFDATILISAAAASVAAIVAAAVKPRQTLVLLLASALALGHVVLWFVVIGIMLRERHML